MIANRYHRSSSGSGRITGSRDATQRLNTRSCRMAASAAMAIQSIESVRIQDPMGSAGVAEAKPSQKEVELR